MVPRRLLVLFAAVIALLSAATVAGATNGQHVEEFECFKVVLNVSASGVVAPDWSVSGTKVQVGTTAQAFAKGGVTNPVHDTISLAATRLKVGSTQVATTVRNPGGGTGSTGGTTGSATGGATTSGNPGLMAAARLGAASRSFLVAPEAPAAGQTGQTWLGIGQVCDTPGIRFASTHFNHGSSVDVVLETDWDLMKDGQVTGSRTISATLNLNVYNKTLVWKTLVTAGGGSWNAAETAVIDGVVSAGRAAYGAAKYDYVPTPSGANLLTREQVIAGTFNGTTTSLFGMTHGGQSAVQGSTGGAYLPFLNRWKDIAHPLGYAINVFYSCETMTTSHADQMLYQHGGPWPTPWIASGRAGFRVTVYPTMLHADGSSTNKTLDMHAEKFFQSLNEGYTLDKARRIANLFVFGVEKPPNNAYSSSSMMLIAPTYFDVYSDPYATLRYVYLGPGERSSPDAADTHWYYPWQ